MSRLNSRPIKNKGFTAKSEAIAETVRGLSDVTAARLTLSFAVASVLEVSGTVQKVVKREDFCRLVIEPGDVPGFLVFADCPGKLENLGKPIIQKGSRVTVRGSLVSFGACAVCLSNCRLQGKSRE